MHDVKCGRLQRGGGERVVWVVVWVGRLEGVLSLGSDVGADAEIAYGPGEILRDIATLPVSASSDSCGAAVGR